MLEALKQRRSWCPPGQARNFGDLTVILRAVLSAEASEVSNLLCVYVCWILFYYKNNSLC